MIESMEEVIEIIIEISRFRNATSLFLLMAINPLSLFCTGLRVLVNGTRSPKIRNKLDTPSSMHFVPQLFPARPAAISGSIT
jgi:hypothetical protein